MRVGGVSWPGGLSMAAGSVGLTLAMAFVFTIMPSYAFAYVDPNAGGLQFQLLTPIAAIGAVALSFFRRQCRSLVARVFRRGGARDGRAGDRDARIEER